MCTRHVRCRSKILRVAIALSAVGSIGVAAFAAEPATRPATRPVAGGDARPADNGADRPGAPLAGRIERAIVGLGLADAQREAIYGILDPARDQIDQLCATAKAQNVPEERLQRRVMQIVEDCYGRVSNLLLQEQKDRFQSQFRADHVASLPPLPTPGPNTFVIRDGKVELTGNAPPAMRNNEDRSAAAANDTGAVPRVARPTSERSDADTATTRPALHVGDPIPSFALPRLSGSGQFSDRLLAGHPSVLIFGSLSAPSFRDRMPKLQELARSYGTGVLFAVIYTREMHPGALDDADMPERNRDDKIGMPFAKTAADRVAAAKQAKQALAIGIEVVPDSMDDLLANTFGTWPNGAVVINAQGKIAAIEHWAEPYAIKRAVDQLRGVKAE